MKQILQFFKNTGPGIVVAATGIGAGDIIASALAGTQYGLNIAWTVVLGALIKFFITEGIGRWQLATGTTVIQGCIQHFGKTFQIIFVVYLTFWTFMVSAALMSSVGLTMHIIAPFFSVGVWGACFSALTFLMVWLTSYEKFEKFMKAVTGIMFVAIIFSAVLTRPDLTPVHFIPNIPPNSLPFLLSVLGGVGGSVTVLNYGYWVQEKKWRGKFFLNTLRKDLAVAYVLTAAFGLSILIISANVKPDLGKGDKMIIGLANTLHEVVGPLGYWVFIVGVWTAVYLSMRGVWQGVPYLFEDFMQNVRPIQHSKNYYKGFLIYMAFVPMLMLLTQKPMWTVMAYAVTGSFFMPFLAITLLILNNKKEVQDLKNSKPINVALMITVMIFAYLFIKEGIVDVFFKS